MTQPLNLFRERPILFSGPMVRAILDGRKTQTRRVLKSARVCETPERPAFTLKGAAMERALRNADRFRRVEGDRWFWESDALEWQRPVTRSGWLAHIGFAVGDRLWVREAAHYGPNRVAYCADNERLGRGERIPGFGPAKPSIHMPRWASRMTLSVTAVRVERLQDISEADAVAEGLQKLPETGRWAVDKGDRGFDRSAFDPRTAFGWLWDSINGPGAWERNPWVVAITFERVKP